MTDCPIPGAKGFSVLEGTGSNGVLILGEAMGDQELADGCLPFRPHAPAGSILERAIRRIGARREQFLIWNAIPTHPPANNLDGPWFVEAMMWGRNHLDNILHKYKPCAILALGNIATQMATGLVGKDFNIGMIEGYPFPDGFDRGITVIPSFHPAFLRRGAMTHFGCLLRDIGLAIEAARERRPLFRSSGLGPAPPKDYLTHPTEAVAAAWTEDTVTRILDDGARDSWRPADWKPTKRYGDTEAASSQKRVCLAYDIETPWSREQTEEAAEEAVTETDTRIESIQFSTGPGSGIFMPWREPYIGFARRLLKTNCVKFNWNGWRFDDPRLRANGLSIGGEVHDLMWAWHHLQPDLPRGLQFAAKFLGWRYAWKHLAGSRPEFYGVTDCDVLQTIAPPLFESLREAGLWKGYERHILKMEPILSKMSERGMPVDPARYSEVRFELACRVDGGMEELQEIVPFECKALKLYKKEPKKKGPDVMLMGGTWTRVLPWKPSNQALTKYAEFKGHEIPRDFKTKKITFDQLHMKRLYAKTKDPLYEKILDYKEAATVLSNHITNWQPDASGRVHSTFYYDPATGQLSSRRPNIQNAPKHRKGTADLFRSIIRAGVGKTLLEFDYKSFHALTLGFEAADADYMRLARLDIHSYVTAHLLKLPSRDWLLGLPDAELGAHLSAIKKAHKAVRDTKAKRAILGYGFGLGYKKLYEMNKEDFDSETEAKNLLKLLDSLFPKTKKWRDTIRIQAHEQGYLCSRHGYIRRFWEVLKWTPSGLTPGGEQSEAAIAFLPANDAFGRIKEAILTLEYLGWLERFGFINTIHDSLLFECPDSLVEECIEGVWEIMEGASSVLDDPLVAPKGLRCEVSVSVGKSWEKIEELKRVRPPVV